MNLAENLMAVGDAFVEANGDRPVSLQRFPAGIDGEMFFSKNPPRGVPDFVRTVDVTFPSARTHSQLVIDEPAAAVWMAQMNTVVFHAWPSLSGATEDPDQLRVDLDPQPGVSVSEVVCTELPEFPGLVQASMDSEMSPLACTECHIFSAGSWPSPSRR